MSISTLDIIDRLPYELGARLQADDFFVDIPVVVADAGNVVQELQKLQAVITERSGKRGVAVIVLQVVGDDEQPNLQFGPMTLKPAFQVVEVPELNRDSNGTGKSYRKVARRIRDVIKNGGMTGLIQDLKPDKPCIEPVDLGQVQGRLVKAAQVNFRCLEVPQETIRQVAQPQFSQFGNGPQFQITCATAGAAIWYTLDDTYPSPTTVNPQSTAIQYSSPLVIPDGGVWVRACAFVPGWIASWVSRANITGVWV